MFRIRKISYKNFVVEVLVQKWTLFGLKKEWKPYVKSAGLDCAWHHSTYDFAMMNLKKQILEDLFNNS